MSKHPVYDSVRSLISQGDTLQALEALIVFLQKDSTHADTLHTLQVIEANYSGVRKQEIKGLVSFSEAQREYARINDALVSILDDLIAGRKPVSGFSGAGTGDGGTGIVRRRWIIGGGILLLLGVVGAIWFAQSYNSTPDCPKFRTDGFKILVFEFQKLSGAESRPELGIQTRIRNLTDRNNLQTDVKILPAKAFGANTPGTQDAIELGNHCMADMVVWGEYEQIKDSIAVDIRYAFTAPDWPPGVALETFKNISEIKSDQMKISNLDEAVFRLCTALALHENRLDLAQKWLNKLQQPNKREQEWKKILKL